MSLQRRQSSGAGVGGRLAVKNELAITAIAHAGFSRAVPNVAAGRRGDGKAALGRMRVFALLVVPVTQRPHFLDEISGIRGHRPFVAVGADFGIDIKIIEQHEFAGEGVMVWSDLLREETK